MRAHIGIFALTLCAVSIPPASAQSQSQTDSSVSQNATSKQTAPASQSQQVSPAKGAAKVPAKPAVVLTNDNLKDSAVNQGASSATPSGADQEQASSTAQDSKTSAQQTSIRAKNTSSNQTTATPAKPKLVINAHKVLTNDDLEKLNKHGDMSVVGIDVDLNGIYDCDINCYNRVRDSARIYPGTSLEWMRDLRSGIDDLQKDNDWRAFLVELAHLRMKFCSLAADENAALRKADNFNNVTDQQIDIREQYSRKLREADDEVTAAYSRGNSLEGSYSPLVRNFMQMQVLRIMQAACTNPDANYRNYSDDPNE